MNAMNGIYGGLVAAALMFTGCGTFLGAVKDEKNSMELKAKLRDFKEGNPTSPEGTHPHFNQGKSSCEAHVLGIATVNSDLSTAGAKDATFPGDERGPTLAADLPADIARCFDPPDRFTDWFDDRGTEVNRPFYMAMKFVQDDNTGFYQFREERFFPLDQGEGFRKASAGGAEPFGNLQTGIKDDVDLATHDYGFTMEFHVLVTYHQGKGQFLAMRGDDDLWAFVNGKRVMDLGGIHAAEQDSVNLDSKAADLGLRDGEKYPLDFFFAERAVASSKLSITTNLQFTPMK